MGVKDQHDDAQQAVVCVLVNNQTRCFLTRVHQQHVEFLGKKELSEAVLLLSLFDLIPPRIQL